jgi:hypothetical protein
MASSDSTSRSSISGAPETPGGGMFAARARSPSISASAASSEVPPTVGAPAGAAAGRDGVSPMRAGH